MPIVLNLMTIVLVYNYIPQTCMVWWDGKCGIHPCVENEYYGCRVWIMLKRGKYRVVSLDRRREFSLIFFPFSPYPPILYFLIPHTLSQQHSRSQAFLIFYPTLLEGVP